MCGQWLFKSCLHTHKIDSVLLRCRGSESTAESTFPRFSTRITRYLLVTMFAKSTLYVVAPFAGAGATSVKMDYLPIGFARVDPVLSQDCLSDHVHTFYGPQSGVEPRRMNASSELEFHSRLIETPVEENTGNVEENKSSESVSFDVIIPHASILF